MDGGAVLHILGAVLHIFGAVLHSLISPTLKQSPSHESANPPKRPGLSSEPNTSTRSMPLATSPVLTGTQSCHLCPPQAP